MLNLLITIFKKFNNLRYFLIFIFTKNLSLKIYYICSYFVLIAIYSKYCIVNLLAILHIVVFNNKHKKNWHAIKLND